MTAADAAAVAELSGQLGYPAAPAAIARRFEGIERQGHAAVFVVTTGGRVVGWIHATIVPVLESDLAADIAGLVVDETIRGQGIGGLLLDAAEAWARAAGCTAMRVRSQIVRERAHGFYERRGYSRVKTQHVFLRPFPAEP
jgi:GNAT superfamily N-acetyltransferase